MMRAIFGLALGLGLAGALFFTVFRDSSEAPAAGKVVAATAQSAAVPLARASSSSVVTVAPSAAATTGGSSEFLASIPARPPVTVAGDTYGLFPALSKAPDSAIAAPTAKGTPTDDQSDGVIKELYASGKACPSGGCGSGFADFTDDELALILSSGGACSLGGLLSLAAANRSTDAESSKP